MTLSSDLFPSGGGVTWQTITVDTTAVADNGYSAVASADLTLTLPATPTAGDVVWFVDADDKATTYALKLGRNGSNIHGAAQDLAIDTDGSGLGVVYVDASIGWRVFSEITGTSSPMVWGASTASETAVANRGYLAVPTAAYTLTLPVSPAEGDRVGFRDVAGLASTYAMTIGRNGKNIEGAASDLTVDTDKSGFTLVYSGAVYGWVVVTELSSISGSTTTTNISQLQAWAFA